MVGLEKAKTLGQTKLTTKTNSSMIQCLITTINGR